MTEESKNILRSYLNEFGEREMETALEWASTYESRLFYNKNEKTAYMLASLVYLYQTANERNNTIGRTLCGTFEKYDNEEAKKVLERYRFPSFAMFNVVRDWERTDEVPVVFDVHTFCKYYDAMHAAAFRDDLDVIHWLLKRDVFVDIRDSFGKTALHISASTGRVRATRCLLNNGASFFTLDNEQETPLQVALTYSKYETAEYLKPDLFCNLRLCDGETLLMKLIRDAQFPQARYMLRFANYTVLSPAKQNVVHICVSSRQDQILRAILEQPIPPELISAKDLYSQSPLSLAIKDNNAKMVHLLLEAGAEITPLIKSLAASAVITNLIKQYATVRINIENSD